VAGITSTAGAGVGWAWLDCTNGFTTTAADVVRTSTAGFTTTAGDVVRTSTAGLTAGDVGSVSTEGSGINELDTAGSSAAGSATSVAGTGLGHVISLGSSARQNSESAAVLETARDANSKPPTTARPNLRIPVQRALNTRYYARAYL
jgi:hypothetical protein